MEKKYSLTLDKEFINYCEINKIDDIEGLAKKTFNNGFTILKYGNKPYITEGRDKSNMKTVTSLRPETKPAHQTNNDKKENKLYDE